MYTEDDLKPIRIPDNVTVIEDCVFEGCSLLQSIVIPESVTVIGFDAFNGCSSLRSVEIPKNMKIEYDIFPETAKIIRR